MFVYPVQNRTGYYKKQVKELEKKYRSIDKDVGDLEEELPTLAFKSLRKTNYCLCEVGIVESISKESILANN